MLSPDKMDVASDQGGDKTMAPMGGTAAVSETGMPGSPAVEGGASGGKPFERPDGSDDKPRNDASADPPPSPPKGRDPWSAMIAAGGDAAPTDGVEVAVPLQHGEGRSRYTTYLLVVRSSSPVTRRTKVRRRYSDFQWLYERFLLERPGAIVPMLPHRSALTQEARFSDELLSFRRKTCEVWINRIVCHPELSDSPSLSAFLRAEDEMFASAKLSNDMGTKGRGDEQTEDPSQKPGKQRFQRIKKLATKVKVAMRKSTELERSDDEPAFEEINDYITELDVQLGWLSKHATALVKTYKDEHNAFESLGSKFTDLGGLTYPNAHSSDAARFSTLFNKIGDGLSALGLNEIKRYDELTERFDLPVQDLVRDVQSLKVALQHRREVQVKYTDKVKAFQNRTKELESIRTYPDEEEPDLQIMWEEEAEAALEEAKEAAAAKKGDFEAVSSRVLREVERFRDQFRDSVRRVVMEWATVQGEYYSRANGGWGDVLPFLDSSELMAGDASGKYSLGGKGQNRGPRPAAQAAQIDSV